MEVPMKTVVTKSKSSKRTPNSMPETRESRDLAGVLKKLAQDLEALSQSAAQAATHEPHWVRQGQAFDLRRALLVAVNRLDVAATRASDAFILAPAVAS